MRRKTKEAALRCGGATKDARPKSRFSARRTRSAAAPYLPMRGGTWWEGGCALSRDRAPGCAFSLRDPISMVERRPVVASSPASSAFMSVGVGNLLAKAHLRVFAEAWAATANSGSLASGTSPRRSAQHGGRAPTFFAVRWDAAAISFCSGALSSERCSGREVDLPLTTAARHAAPAVAVARGPRRNATDTPLRVALAFGTLGTQRRRVREKRGNMVGGWPSRSKAMSSLATTLATFRVCAAIAPGARGRHANVAS